MPFTNGGAGVDPSMWSFFAYTNGQASYVWMRAFVTIAIFGIGGLAAAIRRFERMDF